MLKLSPLFSDHCVLQSRSVVPVWGSALPDTEIQVSLGRHCSHIAVPSSGQWRLTLPPMEPGGPYQMLVENSVSGEAIRVEDVMVGEVWLASGQSNMDFLLKQQRPCAEPPQGDVRFFSVPHSFGNPPGDALTGKWRRSDDAEARQTFSAVATFFAERLSVRTGETVGILHSSVGGSDALAWVSRESLLCDDDFGQAMRDYEERICRPDYAPLGDVENPGYAEYFRNHPLPPEAGRGLREGWQLPDYDDGNWPQAEQPAQWCAFTDNANGAFWFRRHIEIPEKMRGKGLLLSLGAIDKQDVTYVNGVEIGRTGRGFVEASWNFQRRYCIPAELVADGSCVLAVRADSFVNDGGMIGPSDKMFLTTGQERLSLSGLWKYRREYSIGRVPPQANPSPCPLPYYLPPYSMPSLLFENMIRPLLPFAIRGTIWFQGEHNTDHRPENYEALMTLLVRDWRWHWGMPRMPFHQVSLANYHTPGDYDPHSTWAPIRQIQHRLGDTLPSHTIPAYDCGDPREIHFPDKRRVGERLAAIALSEDYGLEPPCELRIRNIYRRSGTDASQLVLQCANARGLHATDGLTLFRLSALEKRDFLPAAFQMEGENIVLDIPAALPFPKFLRYAWADSPEGAIIYNDAGFPLPPGEWQL